VNTSYLTCCVRYWLTSEPFEIAEMATTGVLKSMVYWHCSMDRQHRASFLHFSSYLATSVSVIVSERAVELDRSQAVDRSREACVIECKTIRYRSHRTH